MVCNEILERFLQQVIMFGEAAIPLNREIHRENLESRLNSAMDAWRRRLWVTTKHETEQGVYTSYPAMSRYGRGEDAARANIADRL